MAQGKDDLIELLRYGRELLPFEPPVPEINKELLAFATEHCPDVILGETVRLTGDADMDRMIRDVIETIGSKGKEYTVGSVDRLANFKRAAEKCSQRKGRPPIDMVDVWTIFFDKQWSAVESYIANGFEVKSNEPIASRIMDCIVYLIIFYKMTVEIEAKKKLSK